MGIAPLFRRLALRMRGSLQMTLIRAVPPSRDVAAALNRKANEQRKKKEKEGKESGSPIPRHPRRPEKRSNFGSTHLGRSISGPSNEMHITLRNLRPSYAARARSSRSSSGSSRAYTKKQLRGARILLPSLIPFLRKRKKEKKKKKSTTHLQLPSSCAK